MTGKPPNPALLYTRDAVDTGREKLMGRHAAGEGFFKGYLRHAGVAPLRLATLTEGAAEDFRRRAHHWGFPDVRPEWLSLQDPLSLQKAGGLYVPDPLIESFAWRRRSLGGRAYSLCGVNHTIASERVMDGIAALLTAPVQPWDAVICTSRSVKQTLLRLLDDWGGYLQDRLGTKGRPRPVFQMPVIPLGVDCDQFVPDAAWADARARMRQGLGIAEGDLAVLFLGRLSFHAKAHPMPLYLGLEAAAKLKPGIRLHLILAGWFATQAIEKDFREGAKAFCPSVTFHVVDGRQANLRSGAWAGADIFASFSDNIQETFGLTPVEAMAAGLPAVVSDWDGYKDTVRHGVDGFRIPTLTPPPGAGRDLSLPPDVTRNDEERDRLYNRYCGYASQCTSVDPVGATEALAALIADPDLRRRMGEAGRRRAREVFDWKPVIAAYQALWEQLEEIRAEVPEVAPRPKGGAANPLRDDPFRLFAAFPTAMVDARTQVAAMPGADGDRLRAVKAWPMNDVAGRHLPGDADLALLLAHLSDGQAHPIAELAALLPAGQDAAMARAAVWLSKMGLVHLTANVEAPAKALAFQAMGRGDIRTADGLFRKALAKEPGDPELLAALGEMLMATGNGAKAARVLRQAILAAPGEAVLHRRLGMVLLQAGQGREAVAPLRRARRLAPEDPATVLLLGLALRRAGEPALSLEYFSLSAEPQGFYHRGLALKSLGRPDEALACFAKGLATAPGDRFLRAAHDSLRLDVGGGERGARRVGLLMSRPLHDATLRPLFERLMGRRPVLLTGDADDLVEFSPGIVVTCEPLSGSLRRRLGSARAVGLPSGLADGAEAKRWQGKVDRFCVPTDSLADEIAAVGAFPRDCLWPVGCVVLDALYSGRLAPLPVALPAGRKVVLYLLGPAAPLLGSEAPAPLRGGRDDVVVVVRPDPWVFEHQPRWVAAWKAMAEKDRTVLVVDDPAAEVASLMAMAQVLVADASAPALPFLALDRPVVFLRPSGKPGETEWWEAGETVTDVSGLSAAVARALDDPQADAPRRVAARRHLFAGTGDGRAAERLVERLLALE
ncbi:MAG: glycosyltransferase [Magnetospirillum sp. WYHS-4]